MPIRRGIAVVRVLLLRAATALFGTVRVRALRQGDRVLGLIGAMLLPAAAALSRTGSAALPVLVLRRGGADGLRALVDGLIDGAGRDSRFAPAPQPVGPGLAIRALLVAGVVGEIGCLRRGGQR